MIKIPILLVAEKLNDQQLLAAKRLIDAVRKIEKIKQLDDKFIFLRYRLFKAAKKAFLALDKNTQDRFDAPHTIALIYQLPSHVRKQTPMCTISTNDEDEITQLCQELSRMSFEQALVHVRKEFDSMINNVRSVIAQKRKAQEQISKRERKKMAETKAEHVKAQKEIKKVGERLLTLYDDLVKKKIEPSRLIEIDVELQAAQAYITDNLDLAEATTLDKRDIQFIHLRAVNPAFANYLDSVEELTVPFIAYTIEGLLRMSYMHAELDARGTADRILMTIRDLAHKEEISLLVSDQDITHPDYLWNLQEEARQTVLIDTMQREPMGWVVGQPYLLFGFCEFFS